MAILFEATRRCLPQTEDLLTHYIYGERIRQRLIALAIRFGVDVGRARGLKDLAVMLADPICGMMIVKYQLGDGPAFSQLLTFKGKIGKLRLKELDRRVAELLRYLWPAAHSDAAVDAKVHRLHKKTTVFWLTVDDFEGPEAEGARRVLRELVEDNLATRGRSSVQSRPAGKNAARASAANRNLVAV